MQLNIKFRFFTQNHTFDKMSLKFQSQNFLINKLNIHLDIKAKVVHSVKNILLSVFSYFNPFSALLSRRELERKIKVNDNAILYKRSS